jgi:hypothetical protein
MLTKQHQSSHRYLGNLLEFFDNGIHDAFSIGTERIRLISGHAHQSCVESMAHFVAQKRENVLWFKILPLRLNIMPVDSEFAR